VFLLLAAESHELLVEWVLRMEKSLFTMQNRRVGSVRVIVALNLASPERELDAPKKRWVRIRFESGIAEV